MLQELVPFAALHGTSALLGLPESLRAAWVKAPLVQLLQSHECVIQGRSSLSVPAAHEKSHSYVGENLVIWHRFFRNKKHFNSIGGLVKTVLKSLASLSATTPTIFTPNMADFSNTSLQVAGLVFAVLERL